MNKSDVLNALINNPECKSVHYARRYVNFIYSCLEKEIPNGVITENHHILPKSQYPEYECLKSNIWNNATLTIRQHAMAHFILAHCFRSMWNAYILITNRGKYKNTRHIEKAKIEFTNYITTPLECGRTPSEIWAKKSNITKSRINPKTGLTVAQESSILSAKTMSIPREELGGLTIREVATAKMVTVKTAWTDEQRKKVSSRIIQTRIENGTQVKGADVNTALKINIYDKNGTLIKSCHGDFYNYIREIGAPKALRNTYINNTVFEYNYTLRDNILEKMKLEGYCLREKDGIFSLYDKTMQVVSSNKSARKCISNITSSYGVYQALMKTYRTDTALSLPKTNSLGGINYLKYEKFDGWYAKLVD